MRREEGHPWRGPASPTISLRIYHRGLRRIVGAEVRCENRTGASFYRDAIMVLVVW
jgi:hypothetical protein